MKELINRLIKNHIRTTTDISKKNILEIESAVKSICKTFNNGNKLLIMGNGGSAADAQHIAAEFVNKFKLDREPLPAVALTTDSSVLTAIGNDKGYEYVFQKQIKALGKKGDAVLVLTTSDCFLDHSLNLRLALLTAREKQMTTIGLVSKKSKNILDLLDIVVTSQSDDTPRVQEEHVLFYHIICELVEKNMIEGVKDVHT